MNIQSMEELGQLIRDTRKEQKLTQGQLALVSNVGVRFVVDLEKGKASIHMGKALHIIRMLGLKITITIP